MYAYCVLAVITALFIGQGLGAQVFRNVLPGHAGRPGIGVAAGVLISAARPDPVLGAAAPQPVLDRVEPVVIRARSLDRPTRPSPAQAPAGHTTVRSPQKQSPSAGTGTHGSSAQGAAPVSGHQVKGNASHDRPPRATQHAGHGNGHGKGHGKRRR